MNDEAQSKSKPTEKRNSLFDKFKNWWCETFELAPPKEFEEWYLNYSVDESIEILNLENFAKSLSPDRKTDQHIRESFIQAVLEKAKKSSARITLIKRTDSIPYVFQFPKDQKEKILAGNRKEHFNTIQVSSHIPLDIKGAFIGDMNIRASAKNSDYLFEDCYIRSLEIENTLFNNLVIKNCVVGFLKLGKSSIENLYIKNSWICLIQCPPTYDANPFLGTVSFEQVKLPTSVLHSMLSGGAQQYRNLRAHLLALQNAPAANLMHAKELASERETEKGLSWVFNWFYYLASNYGTKPGLPILWAILLYLILSAGNFWFDSGTPKNPNDLIGWQTLLRGEAENHFYRAYFLPIQSMFNPWGVFSIKVLVACKTTLGQILNSSVGLTIDGLIAFTIFALRKRFKLSY